MGPKVYRKGLYLGEMEREPSGPSLLYFLNYIYFYHSAQVVNLKAGNLLKL